MSKIHYIHFPVDLADELENICTLNLMGKTEFIKIAIQQLIEYLDRYATHSAVIQEQNNPVSSAYEDTDDEPVLLAAEPDEDA